MSRLREAPRPPRRLPLGLPLILALISCCLPADAAAPRGAGATDTAVAVEQAAGPRVEALDIDLSFDPETGLILEQAVLECRAEDVNHLTFDINEWLTVERVTASRGFAEHRQAGGKVRVDLSPRLSGKLTLRFRISGRPRRGARDLVGRRGVVLGGEDRWYPVLAGLTWADAQVTVRTPEDWTAVAPGRRLDGTAPGVWRWRAGSPVRTLAVAAAPDLVLGEASAVNTPVRVAAARDGAASADTVAATLTPAMAWISGSLLPYPFDGFNLVFLPGLPHRVRASGMLVVPEGTPLDGPADGADLLAGQWFGERVAGDGVWIEAFAAWYPTLFARDRSLAPPVEITRLREEYFSLPSRKDVALSRADATTAPAVLRGKGSAAPDMVRLVVGDRDFFKALRGLFQTPAAAPRSLRDVRAAFEQHAGSTLLRVFSDWFDRSGAPEFETTFKVTPMDDGTWRAALTLEQRTGIYALPVDVVFKGVPGAHREVVHISDETTSVSYDLPFEPVRVEIDPLGKIFMNRSE